MLISKIYRNNSLNKKKISSNVIKLLKDMKHWLLWDR